MKDNEQDELWELLGKARVPKERPFFASKVLREIERAPLGREPGVWAVLRRWFYPVAAGACAAALVVFAFRDSRDAAPAPGSGGNEIAHQADPLAEFATAVAESEDLDAMIDGLLASDDNSLWLYADPSSLY